MTAKAKPYWQEELKGLLILAGTGAFLVALWIPAWQLYRYLKTGHWRPMSIIDALVVCGATGWVSYPDDWRGVWKLLDVFPAWWAVMALAITAWWVSAEIFETKA